MTFNNERIQITSCKDCPDRFPGCHGSCEKYKKERAEYDAKMAEYRKIYYISCGINQQKYDGMQKVTGYRHYRSKYRKGR